MSLEAALLHPWLRDNFYLVVSDFERARFEYSVRKSERRAAAIAYAGGGGGARQRLASARAHENVSASASASSSISGARAAAGGPNSTAQCSTAAASTCLTPAPNSVAKCSREAPVPGHEAVATNSSNSSTTALFTQSVSESGAGSIREREKLVLQYTNPFVPRLEPLTEQADSDKLSADQMIAVAGAEESEADDESERESEAESPDAAGPLIDWQALREDLSTQPGSEGGAAVSST